MSLSERRLARIAEECEMRTGSRVKGIVRLTTEDVFRLFIRQNPLMYATDSAYRRHRFPCEIISPCVSLSLSFGDVKEMLAMRGVFLSYERVREWCLKFGQTYANGLRAQTDHVTRREQGEQRQVSSSTASTSIAISISLLTTIPPRSIVSCQLTPKS